MRAFCAFLFLALVFPLQAHASIVHRHVGYELLNATDDYLEATAGTTSAIVYTPGTYPMGGFTFRYRSPLDPANPDGDGTPGEYGTTDYPALYYAQVLLAVDTSAGAGHPNPYLALRIEPDRLSVIGYDGAAITELDSVAVTSEANT